MTKEQLRNLPKLKDMDDFSKLDVGDKFLYGPRMIDQLSTKKKDDEISMYEVIKKKENGNVEYVLVFDKIK